MKSKKVSIKKQAMLPAAIVEIINKNFSGAERDKAVKFVQRRINYHLKNEIPIDESTYIPSNYKTKVLTTRHYSVFEKLINAGVFFLVRKHSTAKKECKLYRFNTQHFTNKFMEIEFIDEVTRPTELETMALQSMSKYEITIPNKGDLLYKRKLLLEEKFKSRINYKTKTYTNKKGKVLTIDGDIDSFIKKNVDIIAAADENKLNNVLKHRLWARRNNTNNRLDSSYTSLWNGYTKHIKYGGEEDVFSIDLKNSQVTILSSLVPTVSQEVGSYYSPLISYFKSSNLISVPFLSNITHKMFSHVDIQDFVEASSQGKIYEEIQAKIGLKERDEAKKYVYSVFFGEWNRHTEEINTFRAYYPNVMKNVDEIKKHFIDLEHIEYESIGLKAYYEKHGKSPIKIGSNRFCIMLQKIESVIFIDEILRTLLEQGYFVISKHDAILCRESDLGKVKAIMVQFLDEFLPGGYKLSIEKL